MLVFFPVGKEEIAVAIDGSLDGVIHGQDQVEYALSGVHADAAWLQVDIPEDVAEQYEDSGSRELRIREFSVPVSVIRDLPRRELRSDEVQDTLRLRFYERVSALLSRFSGRASEKGLEEALRLLDHGEPGEAIRALAWVIDQEELGISADELVEIRSVTRGLIEPRHLPRGLVERVVQGDAGQSA